MSYLSQKNAPTEPRNRWLVLLLDEGISLIASFIAIMFVRWQIHPISGFVHHVSLWCLISIGASLLGFLFMGTHKIVIRHSTYRSIGKLTFATILKELFMLLFVLPDLFTLNSHKVEALLISADFLLTLVLLIMVRIILVIVFENMQKNMEVEVGRLCVMVYGTSNKSVALVTRLEESTHYNIVGFLSRNRSEGGRILSDKRVYYYDTVEDISRMKVNLGVQGVLFSRDNDADEERNRPDGLVRMCMDLGINILLSPNIDEASFGGLTQKAIKEFSDNDFIPDGMTSFERNTKRAIDFILATILIVVFSPLFLACWIAVKVGGGPGPVLYKQERIGRFGRPFNIYKFRSMRSDAESSGPALYSGDDDPRLTKVGHFLRAHHLDELPQLFNVWLGDMAFVGYRPERKFYIDQIMEIDPRYYFLYQIRPGVTSYATLRNGYTDTMEKMLRRLEFDLYYLRHRSIWFDISILWKTFANIAFGKKF